MRFSLRALMGLMLFAGVLTAMLTVAPHFALWLIMILTVLLSLPACIGGIIYLRSSRRAFSIGAAVPATLIIVGTSQRGVVRGLMEEVFPVSGERLAVMVLLTAYVFALVISGLVTVGIRAYGQRQKITDAPADQ